MKRQWKHSDSLWSHSVNANKAPPFIHCKSQPSGLLSFITLYAPIYSSHPWHPAETQPVASTNKHPLLVPIPWPQCSPHPLLRPLPSLWHPQTHFPLLLPLSNPGPFYRKLPKWFFFSVPIINSLEVGRKLLTVVAPRRGTWKTENPGLRKSYLPLHLFPCFLNFVFTIGVSLSQK